MRRSEKEPPRPFMMSHIWGLLNQLNPSPCIMTVRGKKNKPAKSARLYWIDGTAVYIRSVKHLPWGPKREAEECDDLP